MKNANPVFRAVARLRQRADGSPPRARWVAGRRFGGGVAAALAMVAALAGCGDGRRTAAAPAAPAAATKSSADFFPIKVEDQTVRMQLAVLDAEQQRGLMERRDLGSDDGLLFVYPRPQRMSFWMHNTPTALDIGFFDGEGVLREIYPLQPFDETSVTSRSEALRFALEVNQGWFRAHGAKPGAKLDLKAVGAAMKARGFDPRRFGLE